MRRLREQSPEVREWLDARQPTDPAVTVDSITKMMSSIGFGEIVSFIALTKGAFYTKVFHPSPAFNI